MSVLNLIRPELLNNPAYMTFDDPIKLRLHANELPWSALSADPINLNFYPDNQLRVSLQDQLARCYHIDNNQLVLTRGSDDGIDLLLRLFLKAGQDALMQFSPTFPMYAFYARLQQAELIQCPLNAENNFSLNLEQVNAHWQKHCKLIMVCNPNNPTGTLVDLDFIAALCTQYKNRSVIVVDEAYLEFSDTPSATRLIPQFDNLIVLRTLSKAYGLAALRLGAIIAQEPLIETLKSIMAPYTINSLTLHLARQALMDNNWFTTAIEKIKRAREQLIQGLQLHSFIEKIYPSVTNFILLKTPHAHAIAAWLDQQGIIIKSFPLDSLLNQHLRITVGNEQQNLLLLAALSSFQNV